MHITKTQLKQIIKEEVRNALNEDYSKIAKQGLKHLVTTAVDPTGGLRKIKKKLARSNPYVDTGIKNARGEPCRTNGCGGKYEIPGSKKYKKCCDAHDICYCLGGTEKDRLKCDVELGACINTMGGPGNVYMHAVIVKGKSHFKYGGDIPQEGA